VSHKIRDNQQIAAALIKKTGGVLVPEIKELCEETIQLFSTMFLCEGAKGAQCDQVRDDSLQYYSSALAMLRRGFELSWAAAKGQRSDPQKTFRGRFQTLDEARTAIGWSVSTER
jgi:hypothetical protein